MRLKIEEDERLRVKAEADRKLQEEIRRKAEEDERLRI